MNVGKAASNATSLPVQPRPTIREARLARAFPGKPLPTESECRPLFLYLKEQCPFEDPHSPDPAAGKAMLKYCMDTYGSLEPLRQVMNDHPFTLKVKLLDYGDGSAAVLKELAKWKITCDVGAVIGEDRPDAEKDLAAFLGDARCNVRTLTVHCGRKLDGQKVKPLGDALASCPTLKNFELVAVAASVVVAALLYSATKNPLESLTVVGDFTLATRIGYDILIKAGTNVPRFNACLDVVSCGYVLWKLAGRQRPGWELQLCEWNSQPTDRSGTQHAANTMLENATGMTHAGLALFEPLEPGGKQRKLVKDSALVTFNTLQTPSAQLPADLKLLFVGMPPGDEVLGKELAAGLAKNRAKRFAFSQGFVDGALSGVSQAAAAANGAPIPADVARYIAADLAGRGNVSRQEAVSYALVSKAAYRCATLERDKMFLDWLVMAWNCNRVDPNEVAVGLKKFETPFWLSSAFRKLAVQKLGNQQGNWLADAMADITVQETEQINPQQLV